jgi:hypothetical protein
MPTVGQSTKLIVALLTPYFASFEIITATIGRGGGLWLSFQRNDTVFIV